MIGSPGIVLVALAGIGLLASRQDAPAGSAEAGRAWVERTLASLSLRGKAGQLVMAWGRAATAPGSPHRSELERNVRERGVGGVIFSIGEARATAAAIQELQGMASLPLLVAADFESGAGFRIADATHFPWNMAMGAAGREDLVEAQARVTAREARAMGVHWSFSPVVDVNNNPDNPIINTRSYGADPALVSRLASAYVRAAEAAGMLACAKHFPGHGDTAVDSHVGLPVLRFDRARLERVELAPFRAAIAAGVSSVMTGHLAVPALTGDAALPATLSKAAVADLLRGRMGFRGLVVTDALEMGAIVNAYGPAEAALLAFEAGSDVLLVPPDVEGTIRAIVEAVENRRVPVARLDASVRRILEAKSRLGLHENRFVDLDALPSKIATPESAARALEAAAAALTLVRDEGGVVPLDERRDARTLLVTVSNDPEPRDVGAPFHAALRARNDRTDHFRIVPDTKPEEIAAALAAAKRADRVVVGLFVRVRAYKGTVTLDEEASELVRSLASLQKPVVFVSFDNPYLLRAFPGMRTYLCAYSHGKVSQEAVAAALYGEAPIAGRLPVEIDARHPIGSGLRREGNRGALREASPEGAGFDRAAFAEVERIVRDAVADRAFSGAVLAAGRADRLVVRAFGRLAYDSDAPAVREDTLWDLGSLTKVVATATLAMTFVEEERLSLDARVQDYLPEFAGPGKEKVTVRHLLAHASGLPAYVKFFLETKGKEAILERVLATPLEYEPGTKTVYSDLGVIALGAILERLGGKPLDALARERIFEPLRMADTTFSPPPEARERCAPTEDDPWRGRVVRGEVHDENAFAMGGVAAHAGLFSTARDLAVFCRMLLDGGVYDHRRIVRRPTIESFTAAQDLPPGSSRALGWEKPSGKNSAGTLFSERSFGHTGFPGVSMWCDPEKDAFLILLTNRVHPTRENGKIGRVRVELADAFQRALRER